VTSIQARMARAACGLSAQDICAFLGVSRVALNHAEAGRKPLGAPTWARLEAFYADKGILFGPHHWVGTGTHVIHQEGVLVLALWRLLQEHGVTPSSQEVLAAYQRSLPSLVQVAPQPLPPERIPLTVKESL